MNKLTLLFVLILSSNSFAKTESISVRSYLRTEFDSMFEIKVFEYPKVILDCQSFFNQLVVYENTTVAVKEKIIYPLSFEDCFNAHEFLFNSQNEKTPVCLTLDKEYSTVTLSNKDSINCK
ncbi:hypothetical protein [Halobacteriovorax sp. HLS]|uniref:hypothetical protein n=1 Tax=Halobacteriovorax sp. HLS TaxID=2234000 RepID=UPI000FD7682B|nr:hypothetical protein [Halobacteriovorax sp. HLS]